MEGSIKGIIHGDSNREWRAPSRGSFMMTQIESGGLHPGDLHDDSNREICIASLSLESSKMKVLGFIIKGVY